MRRVNRWLDQFLGHRVYSATAGSNVGHNWKVTDTSAAGTPTYAPVAAARGLKVDFDAQAEVQNVCVSYADLPPFDIDDLLKIKFRVKMNQAALAATTQFAFGLCDARNDAIDTIGTQASFRVIGADSTTLVVVESDDTVNDKDDKATGKTLINAYKDFEINFALGKADVRFLIDGQPVATSVTFDMSNFSAKLQPYLQLQKTANANTDGYTVEEVEVEFRS